MSDGSRLASEKHTEFAEQNREIAWSLPTMSDNNIMGDFADVYDAQIFEMQHTLNELSASHQEVTSIFDGVTEADDELQKAPTPDEIDRQYEIGKRTRTREDTDRYLQMKAARTTALGAHTPLIEAAESQLNAIQVPQAPASCPAPIGDGPDDGRGGYNNSAPTQDHNKLNNMEDTPADLGPDAGGSSGGSSGGGSSPSSVGDLGPEASTHTSSDDGLDPSASRSALGGPPMQPMQGQPQGQGATPSGGGGPSAGVGAPLTDLKPLTSKKKDKDKDLFDPRTGLSAGAVAPVGDQLGPKHGAAVHNVNTKSDTSGVNGNAVSANGKNPNNPAGPAGPGGRGGMMGGMGSGAGAHGAGGKIKKRDETISAIQDRDLTGQNNVDDSITGGLIGSETSKVDDFEDGGMLNRDDLPRDMRDRSERKDKD